MCFKTEKRDLVEILKPYRKGTASKFSQLFDQLFIRHVILWSATLKKFQWDFNFNTYTDATPRITLMTLTIIRVLKNVKNYSFLCFFPFLVFSFYFLFFSFYLFWQGYRCPNSGLADNPIMGHNKINLSLWHRQWPNTMG